MYKRSDVKWREECGGVIIFNPINSKMYKLNDTSRVVWLEIDKLRPEDIAKKISEEYDVSPEVVVKDINLCIKDLLDKQLIIEDS